MHKSSLFYGMQRHLRRSTDNLRKESLDNCNMRKKGEAHEKLNLFRLATLKLVFPTRKSLRVRVRVGEGEGEGEGEGKVEGECEIEGEYEVEGEGERECEVESERHPDCHSHPHPDPQA